MNTPWLDLAEGCFLATLRISSQAAIIALIILAANFVLRKHLSPRWRYALWFLLVARLLMPTLPESPLSLQRFFSVPLLQDQIHTAPAPAVKLGSNPVSAVTANVSSPLPVEVRFEKSKITMTHILAGIWLGGVLALLTGIIALHGRFRGSLRSARCCADGEPLTVLLASCAKTMQIRRAPRILISSRVSTPAICGTFRPTLLLPEDFETTFPPDQQKMVLFHELAHMRRGDLLLNPLLAVLQIIHWFNPILWIAFNRIRIDRECATDSLVLSGDRVRFKALYGETLLKLVGGNAASPAQPQLLGILENKTHLQERCLGIRSAVPGAYGFSAVGLILIAILGIATLTRSSLTASDSPAPALLPNASKDEVRSDVATDLKGASGIATEYGLPDAAANPESHSDSSVRQAAENQPDNDPNFNVTAVTAVALAGQEGRELSEKEADTLTQEIAASPANLGLRIKLLGYYFHTRIMQKASRDAAQPHILWIINHWPASSAAGSPFAQIIGNIDPVHYAEARTAWQEQVAKNPANAKILGNFAAFLELDDPQKAEKLLMQAHSLEPSDSQWMERLAAFFTLQTQIGPNPLFPNAPQKALLAYEEAIKGQDGGKFFFLLTGLAKAALAAGEDAKAQASAERLLELAPSFRGNWNDGNAIYTGNSVLGLIALKKGDRAAAKTYLLAAGGTPGSPQLNSFGPEFELAQQLLDAGDGKTVITFLDSVALFWKGHETMIKEWQAAIRRGELPILSRFGWMGRLPGANISP